MILKKIIFNSRRNSPKNTPKNTPDTTRSNSRVICDENKINKINNRKIKNRSFSVYSKNKNKKKIIKRRSVSKLLNSFSIKIPTCKDKDILKNTSYLKILKKSDLKKDKTINVVSNIGWFKIFYDGKKYNLETFGDVLHKNHRIKICNGDIVHVSYGSIIPHKKKLYKIDVPIFIKGTLKVIQKTLDKEGKSITIDEMMAKYLEDNCEISKDMMFLINKNDDSFKKNVSILRESSVLMENSGNQLKPAERMNSVGKIKYFYTINPLAKREYKCLYSPFVEEELIYETIGSKERLYGSKSGDDYRIYRILHKYNNLFTKVKFNGLLIKSPLVDLSLNGKIKWKFKKIILSKYSVQKLESFSF